MGSVLDALSAVLSMCLLYVSLEPRVKPMGFKACMYYVFCLLECDVCLLVELCW